MARTGPTQDSNTGKPTAEEILPNSSSTSSASTIAEAEAAEALRHVDAEEPQFGKVTH
jgi:hypothetical protein